MTSLTNKTHLIAIASIVVFTITSTLNSHAGDTVNVSPGGTAHGPGIAVQGYDVISYRIGKPTVGTSQYAMAYEGGTYIFASADNLKTFKADPERYVPAYGGFCAYGVAAGKKFHGDPEHWSLVDGKLYLNINDDVQRQWEAKRGDYISEAEAQWSKIRETDASDL